MDPDNVFQMLMGQSSADAPSNVLQGMAPQAPQAPPPSPVVAAATAASPPMPKPRRSLIDTLGRISDVFATVGGAHPLYQPTLDARDDRARQIDLEGMKKTLTQQQIAAGALEPQIAERKRLGTALGALAGHEADAATLWPQIAEQAGIDPQKASAIGQILANNPGAAGTFAKSLGADVNNLGKNVFFGTNTDGKTVAYQVGPDGHPHILDFGDAGITPSEPTKIVDTGSGAAIVGQSGNVKKILPKTVSPNTVLSTNTQRDIAKGNNQTAITIAGMPARTGATAKAGGSPSDALAYLDNIQAGFDSLHKMKALPGDTSGLGAVESAIGRTGLGQKVSEQIGLPAAQKRLELIKNINSLQSEMIQSLPGSATRTKFEQEIQKARLPDPMKMSYSTAQNVLRELRQQYQRALANLAKEKTPSKNVQPNGGWGTATVVHGG